MRDHKKEGGHPRPPRPPPPPPPLPPPPPPPPPALRPRCGAVVGAVAFAAVDVRVGRDVLLGKEQRVPPGGRARRGTGRLAEVEQDLVEDVSLPSVDERD